MKKGMHLHTFFIALLLLTLCSFSSYAYGISEQLVLEASRLQLHKDPYWETLLHYKKGWFSGYRSLVDDEAFFLSSEGKYNAEAELNATLKAFTEDDLTPDAHALCRFPARAAWLQEKIPSLADSYGPYDCPHYEEITTRINPHKVSLIFPFSSMAGPATIYGHTMLRIESENSSPLLGYAVTYAANTDGAGAVKYVVYGIGGGFDGKYSVLPYSAKLNEYSAIELRDVWEYNLDFTPEEVLRLYNHVWEMSLVLSDYYFFDENCAFNLLFLLESAREGLSLTDGYVVVMPADTIKAIDRANLVTTLNYRPSHVKRMQAIADMLSYSQISAAKKISTGKRTPVSVFSEEYADTDRAAILDLASELVRYRHKKVSRDELSDYQKLSLSILVERSKLRTANEYAVPQPQVSPEKGHDSSRLIIGGGYAYDSPYFKLGYRLSYHSVEDNSGGYLEGAGISTFDINLRYYTEGGRFAVENFALVDLLSLNPMTRLFQKPSWMFSVGVNDRSSDADHSAYSWYINGGLGAAFTAGDIYIWGATFMEAQAASRFSPDFIGGAGGRGGIIIPTGSNGKLVLDGRYLWYSDSSDHTEGTVSVKYALYPSTNHAVMLESRYIGNYNWTGMEYGLSYRYFF